MLSIKRKWRAALDIFVYASSSEYVYLPAGKISVLEHHNLDCAETVDTLFELLKLADM